jgi:hypothetical protein
LSHLCIKVIILPRQARDKHRESTQKKMPFLGVSACAPVSPESYFRGPWACAVLLRIGGEPSGVGRHSASGSTCTDRADHARMRFSKSGVHSLCDGHVQGKTRPDQTRRDKARQNRTGTGKTRQGTPQRSTIESAAYRCAAVLELRGTVERRDSLHARVAVREEKRRL